jgi:hypothetical protein
MLHPPFLHDKITSIPNDTSATQCLQELWVIVNRWFDNMQRTNPELCPVDMTQVTFEIVALYSMTSKKDADNKYLSCVTILAFVHLLLFIYHV